MRPHGEVKWGVLEANQPEVVWYLCNKAYGAASRSLTTDPHKILDGQGKHVDDWTVRVSTTHGSHCQTEHNHYELRIAR